MNAKVLLLDVGNTRLKYTVCRLGSQKIEEKTISLAYCSATLKEQLVQCVSVFSDIQSAVVSNVAGQAVKSQIDQLLTEQWGISVTFVRSDSKTAGIINGYIKPSELGVDRWVALVGAASLGIKQTLCVVDCGTAVTADFLSDHQHLGGTISAGIGLMKSKLSEKTADINHDVDNCTKLTPFAKNTLQGVANGTRYAVAGYVNALVADAEQSLGEAVRVILTGGDAELIRPMLLPATQYEPDLVMKGLSILAAVE